jgi:hypothetical protein
MAEANSRYLRHRRLDHGFSASERERGEEVGGERRWMGRIPRG